MSLADVFAEGEAINRARVYADTWGHLAPEPCRAYTGTMILAHGEYAQDGLVPVRTRFADLPDSPWFYDDLGEWLCDTQATTEPGEVYRWQGTYRKFRNGKFRFTGKLRRVEL
jgi:hypothetical protein